jgi:hypothetical protein
MRLTESLYTLFFSIIEANFIILCGSIPFFRQFIRYYGPKWFHGWWSARNNISSSIQDSSSNPPVGCVQDPRVGIGIVSDEDEEDDDVRVHRDEGGMHEIQTRYNVR